MQSIEASPIHPGSYSFNNTAFRLREFNDVKISQYGGEEPEKLQILTVKEIGKKKNEELITFIKNKQANNTVNISCKTLGKITEEKPTIISKNLLKTMLYLS
jgi:secreted protein with Ig-like and vWFA domain